MQGGMLGIHAEDDGFLEPITALLEVVRHPLGDALGAVVDDELRSKSFWL
jgi:hypothetical protein